MLIPHGDSIRRACALCLWETECTQTVDRNPPDIGASLQWIHGYSGTICRNNVRYSAGGDVRVDNVRLFCNLDSSKSTTTFVGVTSRTGKGEKMYPVLILQL